MKQQKMRQLKLTNRNKKNISSWKARYPRKVMFSYVDLVRTKSWHTAEKGRAVAQAVSRWLSTAVAWVQTRFYSCGVCGGQSGAGTGFLLVLGFPCQSSFHQFLHSHHHLSSGAGTIGQ
jgi:hypothetical protein